ncbi:MAG: four helix bundle protein [Candidatus Moraniibacteriota bacterium]
MNSFNAPPPTHLSPKNISILQRIKEGYLIWTNVSVHIPKSARYTIGARIENKYLDLLELARVAYFINKDEVENKTRKISDCIFLLDALKFLISTMWEAKLLSHKQFEQVSFKLEEIGRMLWGWSESLKNLEKKNRAFGGAEKE